MSIELFNGVKDVKTVRKNEDKDFFKRAMKKLKFEKDLDLVVFCASIGLYRSKLMEFDKKEKNPSLQKLTSITTFNRNQAKLFDYLILTFLKVENDRMGEFELYFYTGFKALKKWFDSNEKNMGNTVELYCTLIEDMKKK